MVAPALFSFQRWIPIVGQWLRSLLNYLLLFRLGFERGLLKGLRMTLRTLQSILLLPVFALLYWILTPLPHLPR